MNEVKKCNLSKKYFFDFIINNFSLEDNTHPFSLDYLDECQEYIVAFDEHELTGIAFLSNYHYKEAYKDNFNFNLYVKPKYRERGIASLLYNELRTTDKFRNRRNVLVTIFSNQYNTKKWLETNSFLYSYTMPNVLVENLKKDVCFFKLEL